MLDGYKYIEHGIIKRTFHISQDYGPKYQEKLLGRGQQNVNMAHLRYGYLIGNMKRLPTSILDVGYGDGEFLRVCKRNLYTACYGSEVSDINIPDGCVFTQDIKPFYNVICFFDSLEHFEDIDFVKHLQCNYVFITIPNCVYQTDKWFRDWKHRKPSEHIFHFNLQSISSLFFSSGYEVVDHSFIEDIIRGTGQDILTIIFKKR